MGVFCWLLLLALERWVSSVGFLRWLVVSVGFPYGDFKPVNGVLSLASVLIEHSNRIGLDTLLDDYREFRRSEAVD